MSFKTSLLLLSLLLLTTAHERNRPEMEPEIVDIQEDSPSGEGRMLTTGFPFRINAYYGAISSTSYQSYFQNQLIPPILDYYSHALTLKYKLTTGIQISASTICSGDYATPAELKTGLATDFYWVLSTESVNSDWVADTARCSITSGSNRPYIGRTIINTELLSIPATTDVLTHEKNMICLMHEFIHQLGFARTMLQYWLDANGNRRTGHLTTQTLDGVSTTVLNVEPLTTFLRNHFGCPTLIGAYLENGDTVGAHLERRHFGFEIMTSGLIYELQISQVILSALEGSGWYYPDYSYADEYEWGQGQGCNFLFESCSAIGSSFKEFCTSSNLDCSVPGVTGGSCIADPLADGCKFIKPSRNYDCEDPTAASFARLPAAEVFGRTAGSKCFSGTLSPSSSSAAQSPFCFNFKCEGSSSSTVLNVAVGSETVTCTQEGTMAVSGYLGYINCPDPLTFCSTVGSATCPRGCMGRGNCVNGVCSCNSGYTGKDCALTA